MTLDNELHTAYNAALEAVRRLRDEPRDPAVLNAIHQAGAAVTHVHDERAEALRGLIAELQLCHLAGQVYSPHLGAALHRASFALT